MKTTLSLAALLVFSSAALAQDSSRIAVSVKGTSSRTADTVEVEFTVSARAEDSTDAERKYRDKLGQLLAALKEGKAAPKPAKKEKPDAAPKKKKADDSEDEDAPKKAPEPKAEKGEAAPDPDAAAIPFEISERGLTFGVKTTKDDANPFKAIARMGGGPVQNPDPPMTFSSKVVCSIKNVKSLDAKLIARRVSQLIDLGIDAGADGTDNGVAPVVHFVVDDLESLRSAAYEDAMNKAKARGKKLAELGGRHFPGTVYSVREGSGSKAEDVQAASMKAVQNMFGASSSSSDALSGFQVSIEVELAVEFELGGIELKK